MYAIECSAKNAQVLFCLFIVVVGGPAIVGDFATHKSSMCLSTAERLCANRFADFARACVFRPTYAIPQNASSRTKEAEHANYAYT